MPESLLSEKRVEISSPQREGLKLVLLREKDWN
jgi:hypothetical protein